MLSVLDTAFFKSNDKLLAKDIFGLHMHYETKDFEKN